MNTSYNIYMIAAFVLIAAVFIWDFTKQKKLLAGKSTISFDFFTEKKYAIEIFIFVFSLLVLFILNGNKHILYNNYSYLAQSLLHGRLDSPDLPAYLESVEFGGMKYMHFAPGPAVLSMPFVAIWGVDGFNAGYLCMALGAANCVLFYKVICNMNIGETLRDRLWFTAFAVFGTVHFFLATVAHSWFLGHVSTWFFLLFAMYFVTKENPKNQNLIYLLGGLFYGMAVTCRLSNLFSIIFFAGYIILKKENKIKALLLFCGGAAVPGGLYMLFNYVKFGTIIDKGYNLTHLKDYFRDRYDAMQQLPTKKEQLEYLKNAEKEVGGPLQFKFIGYNLYSIFLMMPQFTSEYPFVVPLMTGVSITFLSPVLYYFIKNNWRDKLVWILAATMVATAFPFLMNYGNGMSQFGMRYAMDFLPYMILLACMGMKTVNTFKTAAISYCVYVNLWGSVYWRFFYLK